MDCINQGLKKVLNKNWQIMIRPKFVLDEIYVDENYVTTLWVIPIGSYTNQLCYLLIAINRGTCTIICTTTRGDQIAPLLFEKITALTDYGHYFACVALRVKCENYDEPFVIYLADIFSNTTYDPTSKLLSEKDILKKYNIITFNKQQQQEQKQNKQSTRY